MTMTSKLLFPSVLLALVPIFARPQAVHENQSQAPSRPATPAVKKQTAHNPQPQDEGERIFQQNCSRCHWAPDGFSSRISGTIVRHMRVRASLSRHDEEELLRFLNP
jgi:hypothetical protein